MARPWILWFALAAFVAVALVGANALPRDDDALAAGVTRLDAGTSHTCALISGGSVKCWGANDAGQVGDGTNDKRHAPADVSTLDAAQAIGAGGSHACGLISGSVFCWGANTFGQVGDGTTAQRSEPEPVIGLPSLVEALALGENHSCALTTAGGVKCWGDDSLGQIGAVTPADCGGQFCAKTPVDVVGLTSGVAAIGAGAYHTCAVLSGGALVCWGWNEYGQIGNGESQNVRDEPVSVVGMGENVAAVDGGGGHTCALRTDGGIRCWGLNLDGQVGNGANLNQPTPASVSGIASGALEVSAGGHHTCARMESGALRCWGLNDAGQVGDGTNDNRNTPVEVTELSSGVLDVSAGGMHSCAIGDEGAVCWGGNSSGQMGDGTTVPSSSPVDVLGLTTDTKPPNTPSPTPTGTPTACLDHDGDTTCDNDDPDDDNDGCADTAEQQTAPGSEFTGGRRDYHWFWDFYDVPAGVSLQRDGTVAGADIFAIIGRFNSTDTGPGDFDRFDDPLSTPNPLVIGQDRANYHPAYDRGGIIGMDVWDLGSPNGSISGTDIFNVLGQFTHSCA